jgi:hypothetical protein
MEVAKNLGDGWVSSDGLDFGYGNWDQELTHWAETQPSWRRREGYSYQADITR